MVRKISFGCSLFHNFFQGMASTIFSLTTIILIFLQVQRDTKVSRWGERHHQVYIAAAAGGVESGGLRVNDPVTHNIAKLLDIFHNCGRNSRDGNQTKDRYG